MEELVEGALEAVLELPDLVHLVNYASLSFHTACVILTAGSYGMELQSFVPRRCAICCLSWARATTTHEARGYFICCSSVGT